MKYTYVNEVKCMTSSGTHTEYQICANDGSVLATTAIEHLVQVIQQAVEHDLAEHEATAWQE